MQLNYTYTLVTTVPDEHNDRIEDKKLKSLIVVITSCILSVAFKHLYQKSFFITKSDCRYELISVLFVSRCSQIVWSK